MITSKMFMSLAAFTTIICLLYHYFTRTFNYWKHKNVKGPNPIALFGNLKDVVLRQKCRGLVLNDIYKQYPEEKFVGIYQMTSPALLIRDLDIAKQILIKDFEVFPDRGTYFSKEGLGQNIFHSDPDTWNVLRNQFSPVFTSSKLKAIFHQLHNCGDKFVRDVANNTTEEAEQDVYQKMKKYTIATSMALVFDWNIDSFKDDNRWLNIFDENLNISRTNDVDLVFPSFMTKFNLSIISKQVRFYCHQILKACIQQPISNKTHNFNVKDVILSLRKGNNIDTKQMDKVKAPIVEITDDLLAGQIWVFYTAGYLNNSLNLNYAMFHLASNPDVQEKLREEIEEIMDKYGGQLTYDALKEMKYLEMVFAETLRINPLTQGLVRSVNRDIKLEGTGLTINKGLTVVISPYAIHHDEKYYPEPEKFIPERFLPENVKNRHPCAFLSFGAGRRSCLGSQFARIQFGIVVVKLLQRFRIETSQNTCSSIEYDSYHMLMKPKNIIRLRFVPRVK